MQDQHDILNDILTGISKMWIWIAMILSGVVAKISFDVLSGRKLSFIQWCAVIGISVFGGYMMGTWCDSNGWEKQGRWLVPMATLFSEKLFIYIMDNYERIGDHILLFFTKKRND